MASQPDTFYKSFSEKKLTTYGSGRRGKIERHRLALLHRYAKAPGDMYEIGPGHGSLAEQAVEAGWNYTAVEASPILIDVLRRKGLKVIEAWTPPMPMADATADVVYAAEEPTTQEAEFGRQGFSVPPPGLSAANVPSAQTAR